MDDAGLTPLLIDAKREYVGQLADVLTPFVVNHMVNLYLAARKQAPNSSTITFQKALRVIPVWNSHSVRRHTADIENKYSFLGDLIAACFVAYVKILSSVKLHHQKPNIRLKLPTNDAFVHKVYIHVAREFYATPDLVRADRAAKVAVVRGAVEASVRDMLPIEDILKAYLGNTVDEDNAMVPGEFMDDDVFGRTTEPAPEPRRPPPSFDSQPPPSFDPRPPPASEFGAPDPPPPNDLFEAADDNDDNTVKHVSLGGGAPRSPRPQSQQGFPSQQPQPTFPSQQPSQQFPSQQPRLTPFPSQQPRPLFSDDPDD